MKLTEEQTMQLGDLLEEYNPAWVGCEVTEVEENQGGSYLVVFTFDNQRTGRQGVSSRYVKFRPDGPEDGRLVDFEVV